MQTLPLKIRNPKTNRLVNVDGKIGKAIIAAAKEAKASSKVSKESTTVRSKYFCNQGFMIQK